MYKGVVFDLDGTLVDSRLCFKTIRRQLGIPEGEWILEYLETLAAEEKRLKHRDLENIELKAAQNATLFSGVIQTLEELRQKEMRLGIFTRNCSSVTNLILQKFGLKFDLVITRDDGPPKPNPTGLIIFLTQWCLSPKELLFVGDAPSDIECGKAAGVATALFLNGQNQDSDKLAGVLRPHFIFRNYSDFCNLI